MGSEKRNERQEAWNLGTLVAEVDGGRQRLDESAWIETRAQRLHDAAGEGAKLWRGVGQVCRQRLLAGIWVSACACAACTWHAESGAKLSRLTVGDRYKDAQGAL